MSHKSYGLSHVGRVLDVNEDSILMDDDLGVYVLCDGCGGHAAGEVASQIAAETTLAAITANSELLANYASAPSQAGAGEVISVLNNAINTASKQVHAIARSDKGKAGMGTTIVVLLVLGENAIVAHAGDSRAYLIRGGKAHEVTEDHNMASHYVRLGLITAEKARNSRWSSMLTRAVGYHEHVQIDTLRFALAPEDTLLLCSDGLTRYLWRNELAGVFAAQPIANVPHELIRQANARGGADNISAIALQIPPGQSDHADDAIGGMQAIKKVPLFKHLTFHELLRVMDLTSIRSFEKGQSIVAEGDLSDTIFVSISGTVEVVKGGRKIAELPASTVLGEMGLIDSEPRSASIVATKPTRVLAIYRKDFFALLRRQRTLAAKVLWGLCRVLNGRLRDTSENLREAIDPESDTDIPFA
ncbi:MAG: cyclic nucleotide-binding domain-containing protein [Phycisphaerae bacterium]|jgi:serine/threonine protein phosphatase PrpC|nr:cyclic nucleotide-binding domain-containing protein [Phycisphaerae bacterium]